MNIEALAREAGLHITAQSWVTGPALGRPHADHLERFAALVRAAALEEAAKVCEAERLDDPSDSADDMAYDFAVNDCVQAIRALAAQKG